MTQFLSFLLLIIMFVPATLALVFASSSTPLILWNYFWFFVMGSVASNAFQSPYGYAVGLFFAINYYWRQRSGPVVRHYSRQFSSAGPSRSPSQDGPVTIDADFRRKSSDP